MTGMERDNTYENVVLTPDTGFDIRFVTMNHNSPFHWHRELEILYILNGHAIVSMEGKRYELNPLDAIVMDYAKVHEVIYELPKIMSDTLRQPLLCQMERCPIGDLPPMGQRPLMNHDPLFIYPAQQEQHPVLPLLPFH